MLATSAVIPGLGVALQGVAEISAVQVVVSKFIVTSPYTLFYRIAFVVLEISVQSFQLIEILRT
jgi:hypothetical protein